MSARHRGNRLVYCRQPHEGGLVLMARRRELPAARMIAFLPSVLGRGGLWSPPKYVLDLCEGDFVRFTPDVCGCGGLRCGGRLHYGVVVRRSMSNVGDDGAVVSPAVTRVTVVVQPASFVRRFKLDIGLSKGA